jgi:nucleotide-binding universal stress UspA family protein
MKVRTKIIGGIAAVAIVAAGAFGVHAAAAQQGGDGGKFAEAILPAAVEMATLLRSKLLLLQVVSTEALRAGKCPEGDIIESTYLRNKAAAIRRQRGMEADWDMLHGEPGAALCRYLQDTPDTLLAMTTHGRSGLKRAFLGSITAQCVRSSGLP